MIRVLIADDQGLVRAGFRVILEAEGDSQVVAEAENGAEAVRQTALVKPAVKTHVARILTKLGLRDRVQVVVVAYESGFVGRGAG